MCDIDVGIIVDGGEHVIPRSQARFLRNIHCSTDRLLSLRDRMTVCSPCLVAQWYDALHPLGRH